MAIRNILVTGAAGKVGRHLIPVLLDAGYSVRALQHRTPVEAEGAEILEGSISDAHLVKQLLDGMDAVCHLATSKEDRKHFLDISIRGTFNLLDACKECGHIQQFILAGGDAALGIFYYENPVPLTDDAPLRAYPGYYAFSKVLEETMCTQYRIQYGLPVTNLRFSWIHAEDDILAYMTLRKPNFGGPSWRSLAQTPEQKEYFEKDMDGVGNLLHPNGKPYVRHIVGIGDVVDSFLRAIGNPRAVGETFNIAAPAPFAYNDLSRYIAGKLNLPVVDFVLDGFHDFTIDTSKARSVLGCPLKYDIFTIVDEAIRFRKSGRKRRP
jgi:nucleoside-diphosphate-sugar epimerase